MGDSLLAWHRISGRSVADSIERHLQEPVADHSVGGSSILYPLPVSGAMGLSIPRQYRDGAWDWIILSGGGNDLLFGCGCLGCDRIIDWMITADGATGRIPDLVARLRNTGARVIHVGYLRSPGVGSAFEHCKDEADEFERRIELHAQGDDGVYFVSLADLAPSGDRSFHGLDMIHPSVKGSAAIGQRIAALILSQGG